MRLEVINSLLISIINIINTERFKITSGAYFRELPDIVAYEASLPIFFEISLKINSCNNIQCDQSKFECQTLAKFKNLGIDIKSWAVEQNLLSSDGQLTGWSYQLIERNHIKQMFTNWHEYLNLKTKILSKPYNFKINSINLINDSINCTSLENITFTYLEVKEKIQNTILSCFNRKTHPTVISLNRITEAIRNFEFTIS